MGHDSQEETNWISTSIINEKSNLNTSIETDGLKDCWKFQ